MSKVIAPVLNECQQFLKDCHNSILQGKHEAEWKSRIFVHTTRTFFTDEYPTYLMKLTNAGLISYQTCATNAQKQEWWMCQAKISEDSINHYTASFRLFYEAVRNVIKHYQGDWHDYSTVQKVVRANSKVQNRLSLLKPQRIFG